MLMALLLPLGAWAQGNIGVQLSTTMTKEYGMDDPEYLAVTDFVIISNTTGEELDETDLVGALKFQRKQDNEGEDRGTYEYEVTVSAAFAAEHPTWNVVATNTGILTITAKVLSAAMIGEINEGNHYTFDNTEKTPTPVISYIANPDADEADQRLVTLTAGQDFEFDYADNLHAGEAKVIIKAIAANPNYIDPEAPAAAAEKTFTIDPKEIDAEDLLIEVTDEGPFTYTGLAQEPAIIVKDMSLGESGTELRLTDDYTVAYDNNINVTNEATITVEDVEGGDYTFADAGTIFEIGKATLTITIPAGQKKEFGDPDPDEFAVEYDGFVNNENEGVLNTQPVLSRAGGENAGVYPISIDNAEEVTANNYDIILPEGTVNFSITARDIAGEEFTFELEAGPWTYDGNEKTPELATAKYNLGGEAADVNLAATDYTIGYENNENAGTATVTITGKNNYKGTKELEFEIGKAPIYIQPLPGSKAYGDPDPEEFGYKLVDAEGEEVEGAELNGELSLLRTVGETVGAYTIYVDSYEAAEGDNYAPAEDQPLGLENIDNEDALTALFEITAADGTLYLRFKSTAVNTKVYGEDDPEWSIDDLEVDPDVEEEDALDCDDWDGIKYSLGEPEFALASQNVVNDEPNFVSVTNQLVSPNYPHVVVATMPFTITAKEIALKVSNQEIAYGDGLSQEEFELAEGYELAPNENVDVLEVEIKVDDLGTYAPGTVNEEVIYATINNPNYNLVTADCVWGTLTVTAAVENEILCLADDNENLLDQINAYNNKPVTAYVKISQRGRQLKGARTWAAEKWNTMTLPFDITVAELSQILGYAVVNVIDPDGYSEESGAPVYKFKLTMKGGYGEDVLPANKPFTIKTTDALNAWIADHQVAAEGPYAGYLDFGQRTIKAPAVEDFAGVAAGGGSTFKPAYAEREVTSDDEGNIWFLLGSFTKWAYITSDSPNTWNIVPFEGFIDQSGNDAPAPEAAIFIMEELDGSTTAIKGVEIDNINGVQNAEGLYNLNGMKLMSVPTQKGVYIQNGKKVIIK